MTGQVDLPTDGRPEHMPTADGSRRDDNGAGDAAGDRCGRHPVAACVTTSLAGLLVLLALLAPNELSRLEPAAFVRIPVEGLFAIVLLVVLPGRARQMVAVLLGVAFGLLAVMKILDMGFITVLARPFDPVLDWILFGDAVAFLTSSIGRVGAIGAVVAAVVLATAVLLLMTLSLQQLSRLVVRHNTIATRAVAVLAAVWLTCALLGAQIAPGVPVAARSAATLVYDRALQVRASVHDQHAFAGQTAADPFGDTPDEALLTGLRGKDVIISFVESYGRDAVEDPEFASQVGAVLDAGNRRLGAAGFASRSAYLTSPVAGGRSWLAHATLLSGLWINNQQRYRTLVASDRLTLTGAFGRAGWRTVAVMPGTIRAWPEGAFYGYDQVYDSRNLGYRGPDVNWSGIPDQYTLSAFERAERAKPGRAPVMTEIDLASSHAPWTSIPRLIAWDDVGDSSAHHAMSPRGGPPDVVWRDLAQIRTEYRRSLEYSLNSLISYLETYGDDNLVLVLLGDHQPAPLITGAGASWDVPITIVTRDRAVLNRISGWGWQDGLKPGPQAPVWPMHAFRDRFLSAFGPPARPTRAQAPATK